MTDRAIKPWPLRYAAGPPGVLGGSGNLSWPDGAYSGVSCGWDWSTGLRWSGHPAGIGRTTTAALQMRWGRPGGGGQTSERRRRLGGARAGAWLLMMMAAATTSMMSGRVMMAICVNRPPHGQARTSSRNTRRINCGPSPHSRVRTSRQRSVGRTSPGPLAGSGCTSRATPRPKRSPACPPGDQLDRVLAEPPGDGRVMRPAGAPPRPRPTERATAPRPSVPEGRSPPGSERHHGRSYSLDRGASRAL